jgi:WD40 repeat protein/serine/threonine protein kinase
LDLKQALDLAYADGGFAMQTLTVAEFLDAVEESGLLEPSELGALKSDAGKRFLRPDDLASELVESGRLTPFQAKQVAEGLSKDLVLGPYHLLDTLGQGGMGRVFKARHRLMNRIVAIKVIRPDRVASPEAIARFRREVQAAARVAHPNIVLAYDAAQFGDSHFLVMEYVEGTDLARLVAERGPLAVNRACDYVHQALCGMQHAHECGLVHRDLKPANLLLAKRDEIVKVLDLGLARFQHDDPQDAGSLTSEGIVMGTPDYMAPEQSLDSRRADIRADIYSLGCTLYHLLTGRPPFPGGTAMEKFVRHREIDPIPVWTLCPAMPRSLGDELRRLMAKRPDERYQTPGAAAAALEQYCRGASQVGSRADSLKTRARSAPIFEPTEGGSALAVIDQIVTDDQLEELMPKVKAPFASGRRQTWVAIVASSIAALILIACFVAAQVVLRIKHPSGEETEVRVPSGSKIEIGSKGDVRVDLPGKAATSRRKTAKVPLLIPAEPLQRPDRMPMGAYALVSKPEVLVGALGVRAQSWTLETYGHRENIRAIAYSPDGRWIASASLDGTVRVWESGSGRLVHVLFTNARPPITRETVSVSWSPDSQFLASACSANTVQVWAMASGQLLRTLKGHTSAVQSVAWSPQGTIVAAGDAESTVLLWDVTSGNVVRKFRALKNGLISLAWSPDGVTLAAGGWEKELQLWNTDTIGRPRVLTAGGPFFSMAGTAIFNLAWSPDGTKLACAAGSADIVQCWDAASGEPTLTLQGDGTHVLCVAWSPDGKRLAAGGDFNAVKVWDADSGSLLYSSAGHMFEVYSVAWSPDNTVLAAAGTDQAIFIRKATSGEVISTIPSRDRQSSGVCFVDWSPDGKTLSSSSWGDSTVYLWDPETGTQKRSIGGDAPGSAKQMVRQVVWSPDGRYLASSGHGVTVWDAQSVQRVAEFQAVNAPVRSVAWSPDGKLLAGGDMRTIQIWDVATRQFVRAIEGNKREIMELFWSADGKFLASLDLDGWTVRIWQAETGKLLHTLKDVNYALAWSARGHTLIARGTDETIQFRDGQTGAAVKSIPVAHAVSTYLSYLPRFKIPDVKSLTTGNDQWESGAPAIPLRLPAHNGSIFRRAWSPDGKTMASCTRSELLIWDVATGQRRLAILMLPNNQGVAITPDGHYRGTPEIDHLLVYVVHTANGQQILTPSEFSSTYRWNNRPDRVRLHPTAGEGLAVAKPNAPRVAIKTERISFPQGKPLNEVALVQHPAELKGMKSWTLETLGHRASVRGLAYSPDGQSLASASVDGTIRLWDTHSGEPARILVSRTGRERGNPMCVALAWSPDSSALANVLTDSDVQVWEIATGRLLRVLRGHKQRVCAVDWSPDGKTIATGGLDATVRLWQAASDEAPLAVSIGAAVWALDWAPDGAALAIGGQDKQIRVWDVKSRKVARLLTADGSVFGVAWSPAGDRLAGAAGDGPSPQIWNAESGELQKTFKTKNTATSIAWSPDGTRLALGDWGGRVTVWNCDFDRPLSTFSTSDNCSAVAWSPDGNLLAAGFQDGTVTLVDPEAGLSRGTLPPSGQHNDRAVGLDWSRDGRHIASAARDGTIRLWDSAAARMVATLESTNKLRLRALAYAPRGNLMASSGSAILPNNVSEPDLRLWNTETGEVVATLKPHNQDVIALAWSPGGDLLAAGSGEQIRVWDISQRKSIAVLGGQFGAIEMGLAWSPDGRMLAAVDSGSPTVRLWEPATRKLVYALDGHTKPVWAVTWSPDSKTVISGGQDLFARYWDADSGKALRSIPLSTYWVHPLALSPSGKVLAYNGRLCEIRFLEGETDNEAHSLRVHASNVLRIVWSPDDKKLASSDEGGVIRVWDFAGRTCDFTLLSLPHRQGVAITPDGHYRGTPEAEKLLRYVVQIDDRQETLTTREFASRFGWKNDPERIRSGNASKH